MNAPPPSASTKSAAPSDHRPGRTPRADVLWALSGIAGILLLVTGLFLPGPPPRTSEATATIASDLAQDRGALLASGYVVGVGGVLLLLYFGGLFRLLRDRGVGIAPLVGATASGVMAVILVLVGVLINGAMAINSSWEGDPELTRAVVDSTNAIIGSQEFGLIGFIAALCLGAHALMPRWLFALGLISVVLLLVSAASLFIDHGPLESGGGLDLLCGSVGAVWIVALAVTLIRQGPTERTRTPASAL